MLWQGPVSAAAQGPSTATKLADGAVAVAASLLNQDAADERGTNLLKFALTVSPGHPDALLLQAKLERRQELPKTELADQGKGYLDYVRSVIRKTNSAPRQLLLWKVIELVDPQDDEALMALTKAKNSGTDVRFGSLLAALGGEALPVIEVNADAEAKPAVTGKGQTGPVASLEFSDLQGGVARDSSGAGNDAVLQESGEAYVTDAGNGNRALRLNGGFLSIKSAESLLLGRRPHTLALWCKPDTVDAPGQGLLTKWRDGNDKEYGIMLTDGGRVAACIEKEGSKDRVTSVLTLTPGKWYHIAVAFDPKGVQDKTQQPLRIYINGKEAETEGHITGLPDDSDTEIQIGHFYSTAYTKYYFRGLIDDVRIYPRTLGPKEVRSLWEKPPAREMRTDK